MTTDILAPIHTYPDGNSDDFALHLAAIARHLNAHVRALILNSDFSHVSNALGNILIDIPSLSANRPQVTASCDSLLLLVKA